MKGRCNSGKSVVFKNCHESKRSERRVMDLLGVSWYSMRIGLRGKLRISHHRFSSRLFNGSVVDRKTIISAKYLPPNEVGWVFFFVIDVSAPTLPCSILLLQEALGRAWLEQQATQCWRAICVIMRTGTCNDALVTKQTCNWRNVALNLSVLPTTLKVVEWSGVDCGLPPCFHVFRWSVKVNMQHMYACTQMCISLQRECDWTCFALLCFDLTSFVTHCCTYQSAISRIRIGILDKLNHFCSRLRALILC